MGRVRLLEARLWLFVFLGSSLGECVCFIFLVLVGGIVPPPLVLVGGIVSPSARRRAIVEGFVPSGSSREGRTVGGSGATSGP
jgi:hypothetical protein